jgi:hypothetical protein
MKLWLLAKGNIPSGVVSPWFRVKCDMVCTFIIRAEDEASARKIADSQGGKENQSGFSPWLNESFTTCVELTGDGNAEVILSDYYGG